MLEGQEPSRSHTKLGVWGPGGVSQEQGLFLYLCVCVYFLRTVPHFILPEKRRFG